MLWDAYGIPHIFGKDMTAAAYAAGWAQMRAHGDLLLRLYAQARGRSAELFGEPYVKSDEWVLTNDIPERANTWLEQQRPIERSILDAFAAGINAYAVAHADSVNPIYRPVLPILPTDILAHIQRVIHFSFLANPQLVAGTERAWERGSNGWAIAPRRTAARNSLLLANPHLPWGDMFTWFEMQISTPETNASGAALVGFPLPSIAFNDSLGWTHTVNTIDGADLFEVSLSGDGYLYDGVVRPFETTQKTLKVKQADGTLASRTFTVRRSIHGPIVGMKAGKAIALRVAGLDVPHIVQENLEMLTSHNIDDFEHALSRLQLPMFTVIYADHRGNIMHVFNGRVPNRSRGDVAYWAGVVPGDSSAVTWTDVLPYGRLPRVINPPTGWLQNANDPPWTTTVPLAIDYSRFPTYLAPPPRMSFRAIRSARMLAENPAMTLEKMIDLKLSTRSEEADHILEDVVHAARSSASTVAHEAADILDKWDRSADAASRGAVLFEEFARGFNDRASAGFRTFDVAWTAKAPLSTPDGIADPIVTTNILVAAADRVRARYGRLDVSWGDVHRLVRDGVDLPANGGPGLTGIFRVVDYDSISPTRSVASGGDSYVAAVEFSNPVRARGLLSYGNWSKAGSPHRTDQLQLFARKELREIWRTRSEVEAHLEAREVF
jgi:acyl-homoserine-lactone acylase